MKTFQKAGELLCELWNNVQIDNHIVKCTYHSPTDKSMEIELLTAEWVENHCNISQYCLQMAKCDGPLLIKRSEQSGMQLTSNGEEPLKGKSL